MRVATVFCALIFLLVAAPAGAQVKVTPSEDHIAIEIDGKPFGDLMFGPDVWKPYLWPLRSASGKIVVRQFPMVKDVPGEPHDHNHQRGLWWAHGDLNGFDFWDTDPLNKPNPKFGKITLNKVVSTKSGKSSGSLAIVFDWKDPDGKIILTETRTMTFHSDPKLRIVDVDLTLTPKEKLVFGDTKEGTFGVRLAMPLQENKTGHMVNAEGAEGEKNVWGKPSPWVDYYGTLDGEQLGIAIFDHPQNPRHPVRWHSRAYGLFAANPFGLADFVNDKSQNGALTVEPPQTLRFRYRVVIHPGDAKSASIGDLYKDWTK
jgi:Methane oxygenase PmoA